jgi:hypothetical protein
MICWRKTLAAQTIRKAAQPLEANHFERRFPWEVAQTLLPKSRFATTASGQRLPGLSTNARLGASDKGRNCVNRRSGPRGREHSGQAKPVRRFRRCLCCDAAPWRLSLIWCILHELLSARHSQPPTSAPNQASPATSTCARFLELVARSGRTVMSDRTAPPPREQQPETFAPSRLFIFVGSDSKGLRRLAIDCRTLAAGFPPPPS